MDDLELAQGRNQALKEEVSREEWAQLASYKFLCKQVTYGYPWKTCLLQIILIC